MFGLTVQQRKVVAVMCLLLTVGWTVKAWRLSHPDGQRGQPVPAPSTAASAGP